MAKYTDNMTEHLIALKSEKSQIIPAQVSLEGKSLIPKTTFVQFNH